MNLVRTYLLELFVTHSDDICVYLLLVITSTLHDMILQRVRARTYFKNKKRKELLRKMNDGKGNEEDSPEEEDLEEEQHWLEAQFIDE